MRISTSRNRLHSQENNQVQSVNYEAVLRRNTYVAAAGAVAFTLATRQVGGALLSAVLPFWPFGLVGGLAVVDWAQKKLSAPTFLTKEEVEYKMDDGSWVPACIEQVALPWYVVVLESNTGECLLFKTKSSRIRKKEGGQESLAPARAKDLTSKFWSQIDAKLEDQFKVFLNQVTTSHCRTEYVQEIMAANPEKTALMVSETLHERLALNAAELGSRLGGDRETGKRLARMASIRALSQLERKGRMWKGWRRSCGNPTEEQQAEIQEALVQHLVKATEVAVLMVQRA